MLLKHSLRVSLFSNQVSPGTLLHLPQRLCQVTTVTLISFSTKELLHERWGIGTSDGVASELPVSLFPWCSRWAFWQLIIETSGTEGSWRTWKTCSLCDAPMLSSMLDVEAIGTFGVLSIFSWVNIALKISTMLRRRNFQWWVIGTSDGTGTSDAAETSCFFLAFVHLCFFTVT